MNIRERIDELLLQSGFSCKKEGVYELPVDLHEFEGTLVFQAYGSGNAFFENEEQIIDVPLVDFFTFVFGWVDLQDLYEGIKLRGNIYFQRRY